MNKMNRSRILCAAALLALSMPLPLSAQTGKNYDVKTMNFDLWCQEQAHLPVARCDKRTAEDELAFNTYRGQIERYEVPYLEQQRRDLSINRDILHNDPVGNPVHQDPQAQRQDPRRQPETPGP